MGVNSNLSWPSWPSSYLSTSSSISMPLLPSSPLPSTLFLYDILLYISSSSSSFSSFFLLFLFLLPFPPFLTSLIFFRYFLLLHLYTSSSSPAFWTAFLAKSMARWFKGPNERVGGRHFWPTILLMPWLYKILCHWRCAKNSNQHPSGHCIACMWKTQK